MLKQKDGFSYACGPLALASIILHCGVQAVLPNTEGECADLNQL